MTDKITTRVSQFDKLPDSARVTLQELALLLPAHRQTIWRHVRKGTLPRPERVAGSRRPTWSAATVRLLLSGKGSTK